MLNIDLVMRLLSFEMNSFGLSQWLFIKKDFILFYFFGKTGNTGQVGISV